MTKYPLIVIGGWGYPASALAGLCRGLAAGARVTPVAACELARGEAGEDGLSSCALALLALIREQGARASLVGWSMGGLAALEVAAVHPELIDRLVLVGSTPKFCADGDFTCGTPVANVRAMRAGLRRDPEKTLAGFQRLVAAPFQEPAAAMPGFRSGWQDDLTAGLDYLLRTDLRERLKLIGAPVLILHGREDRVIPWQAAEYMQGEMPASRVGLYPGVGHDLPLREPDRVAGAICRFLGE